MGAGGGRGVGGGSKLLTPEEMQNERAGNRKDGEGSFYKKEVFIDHTGRLLIHQIVHRLLMVDGSWLMP